MTVIQLEKTRKKWNGFYVDPPIRFRNMHTGGSMKSGSSDHYLTMSIEEICNVPIAEHTQKNSILFLWVPSPVSNTYGEMIMKSWGFKYKGKIYWIKDTVLYPDQEKYNLNPKEKIAVIKKYGGWGYHFRGKVEELWYGFKGTIPMFANPLPNVIIHPTIGHSVKPEIFRKIIEAQFRRTFGKKARMIEGYARRAPFKTKWDYFGNELK